MRVLVLGATGGTGREIVRQAGAKGHSVVALVRSKAGAHELDAATLVEGDARDDDALARALDGCSGVISALGTGMSPFRTVTLLSTATRALVKAMDGRGVGRLVCITGLGAGDSRGHGGFLFDTLILPLALRNVYADKDRQEAIVRASNLDWVQVRPVVIERQAGQGARARHHRPVRGAWRDDRARRCRRLRRRAADQRRLAPPNTAHQMVSLAHGTAA